jgi:acetyltransferase-like isoleucine patch superfamily enzyme
MMKKIIRIFLLPLGFVKKLLEIANEGTRDIENKFRFKNVIIDKGCSMDSKTILHANVHLLENCIINNSEINSYSYLGNNCLVQNTTIGKFCSIANDVCIGLGKHPLDNFSTATIFYRKKNTLNISLVDKNLSFEEYSKITIGHDVWIGARVIILDGVTIGNGAVIAANSVVSKDIPPYAVVGGIPAKTIKYRFDEEKIKKLTDSKWWELELQEIKNKINILNT